MKKPPIPQLFYMKNLKECICMRCFQMVAALHDEMIEDAQSAHLKVCIGKIPADKSKTQRAS